MGVNDEEEDDWNSVSMTEMFKGVMIEWSFGVAGLTGYSITRIRKYKFTSLVS